MKYIVIHREDFDNHKDSEGMEYFHYILNSLGISEKRWPEIATIELKVEDDAFDTICYEELTTQTIGGKEIIDENLSYEG